MKNVLTCCCRVVHASAALLLTTHAYGQVSCQQLYTNSTADGLTCAGLVLGKDGAVYGMTSNGGSNSVGTVFRVDLESLGYTVLHSFTTNGIDGQLPIGPTPGNIGGGGGGLIQGRDGALYGLTDQGGTKGGGTVFKVNTNGTGYQVVYNISTNVAAAGVYSLPHPCGLIQGQDGGLYVTTYQGGPGFVPQGSVFRLNPDGSSYAQLYAFNYTTNGILPNAGVIQGRDGMLYGTTIYGGAYGVGIVFKINTNGLGYADIHDFYTTNTSAPGSSGWYPVTPLMQGSDGALYGTTSVGGSNGVGAVFKLNRGC
jgi:uncharacterized repeat protein (TIGR03803 family)